MEDGDFHSAQGGTDEDRSGLRGAFQEHARALRARATALQSHSMCVRLFSTADMLIIWSKNHESRYQHVVALRVI